MVASPLSWHVWQAYPIGTTVVCVVMDHEHKIFLLGVMSNCRPTRRMLSAVFLLLVPALSYEIDLRGGRIRTCGNSIAIPKRVGGSGRLRCRG